MAKQPVNSPKRRVKNPETFRERSLKAVEASGKPGVASRLKATTSKVVKPIINPVSKSLARLNTIQPFKFIFKLLRGIGLIIFPTYLRTSWTELKLVTWPNRKQSRQLTGAVLIFAVVFGAVVALVDYGLDKIFRHVLLK